MSNPGTRLSTHSACLIRDRRVRYCRCVRWVIAWDGTRLVIVQRVRMAWFGTVAATALGVGLLVAAGWDAAVAGVLLLVLAAALVAFEVWGYRRIEADERIVRAGRWSVAAAQVQVLTLRREIRFVTTRWGRAICGSTRCSWGWSEAGPSTWSPSTGMSSTGGPVNGWPPPWPPCRTVGCPADRHHGRSPRRASSTLAPLRQAPARARRRQPGPDTRVTPTEGQHRLVAVLVGGKRRQHAH